MKYLAHFLADDKCLINNSNLGAKRKSFVEKVMLER